MRRFVPVALVPLAMVATALANTPWLRAYPVTALGIPLYGAALLSVLVPVVVTGIGVRTVWPSSVVGLVVAVGYELFVALRDPTGFDKLWLGIHSGPSQILSFALPLGSPRPQLVIPVALCWLCGALVGEHVARGWPGVTPYAGLLAAFVLSYAATARAVVDPVQGRRYDTVLAAVLLGTLLVLRTAQAWVQQDNSATSTQPDGMLPLRGLYLGIGMAVVVCAAMSLLAAPGWLDAQATKPSRVSPRKATQWVSPLSYIAAVRQSADGRRGARLFDMVTSGRTSRYVAAATADTYDGTGWTLRRTFRPSGGAIPGVVGQGDDRDTTTVDQTYTVRTTELGKAPWMPYQDRVRNVDGIAVDVDAATGMIVPVSRLTRPGTTYTVRSNVSLRSYDSLARTAQFTTVDAQDLGDQSGVMVSNALDALAAVMKDETKVSPSRPGPFLAAVAALLHTYTLTGAARTGSSGTSALPAAPTAPNSRARASVTGTVSSGRTATAGASVPGPTVSGSAASRSGASTSATRRSATGHTSGRASSAAEAFSSAPIGPSTDRAGSTQFADVLASVQQFRSATPEQYATLLALLARHLHVPARVVTGFRLPAGRDGLLAAGSHSVFAGQAWTWDEVQISGYGWVVLDPSPDKYGVPPPLTGASGSAPATLSDVPSSFPRVSALPSQHNVAPAGALGETHGARITLAMWVLLGALFAAIALAVAVPLAYAVVRRRRRARGDPRARLLGAWQQSLDDLCGYGVADLRARTSREVAALTGARFGGEPAELVAALGSAANRALFDPSWVVDPAQADEAWALCRQLRGAVRDRLGLADRVRIRLRVLTRHERLRGNRRRTAPTLQRQQLRTH